MYTYSMENVKFNKPIRGEASHHMQTKPVANQFIEHKERRIDHGAKNSRGNCHGILMD